jgi:hypothetical protein
MVKGGEGFAEVVAANLSEKGDLWTLTIYLCPADARLTASCWGLGRGVPDPPTSSCRALGGRREKRVRARRGRGVWMEKLAIGGAIALARDGATNGLALSLPSSRRRARGEITSRACAVRPPKTPGGGTPSARVSALTLLGFRNPSGVTVLTLAGGGPPPKGSGALEAGNSRP